MLVSPPMNAPENPAPTLDLVDEINRLRKQLNAVLLEIGRAHV